jgi:transposase InsO family protein
MPWKECDRMDERLRFVGRLLDGESMAAVCREFGISRKTGYKIFNRYKDCGLEGLQDRSRRPIRQANRLPFQVERTILQIKRDKPSWGAAKIRERLLRRYPTVKTPAKSTVHAVLERNGMVKTRRKRRYRAQGTELSDARSPNGLWCTDYKGEFRLGNGRYCYPLTITDHHSRYLLACEALYSTREQFARTTFERVFREFGLPVAIRSDNGVPFSAPTALFGMSKLSVWWLRLGIAVERIKPGNPQQNGRHERMHLTLKREATNPAAYNALQQQARFDEFIEEFNGERPHEALAMKYPAEVYTPSPRSYAEPPEPEYPYHDRTVRVTNCGRICMGKRKISLSKSFADQLVGVREVDDKIWLVSFMEFDLGYFDEDAARVEPAENPFAAKVLPMSSV